MASVYEVELANRLDHCTECYSKFFKMYFQTAPDITDDDRASVRRLLGRVRLDKNQIERLCGEYFLLDDEWIKKQGFPLKFLESRYNAIVARSKEIAGFRKHFVVAVTESGLPVVSHESKVMGQDYAFKALEWNRWLNSVPEDRRKRMGWTQYEGE